MEINVLTKTPAKASLKLGVSRPPLEVADLPTPEEVFKVKRVGLEELILFILGPSLIVLGISLGSGEWMSGPLAVARYGFRGIGWVILISAILQVFYNVELARFTVATGEAPMVAFGRVPPGYWLWVPLALVAFYMAFLLGGWTVSAGGSLFALFAGRPYGPAELEQVRLMGIGLLVLCFLFFLFGRKVERSLEIVQGIFLAFVLIGLVLVTLVVVPLSFWGQSLAAILTPAAPPRGSDPTLLGSLAGFTALASGLNFMFISYYRDKGYGMGHRTGFLSGLFGGKREIVAPVGKVFPEDEKNAATWKRWFRYLVIDQWVIYFAGVLIGMIVPSILVGYFASRPGAPLPDENTILFYAANQLSNVYGPVLYSWALLIGFVFLFTTQMIILELLARNLTDAVMGSSGRMRRLVGGDSRKFYYPSLIVLIVAISAFVHTGAPARLLSLSSNLSNFAALIFPLLIMYLNSKLPRPAKITWWSYLVLAANVLFFGFFFINFLFVQLTGSPLVRF